MFTADLLSERQQQFLLRKVKEPASLRHYFEQDSLLLSNWIGYGQPLLNYFEEIEMVECFKKKGGSSALATLQREWLSLEKETAASDSSIELHSAPTLLREVEVVWELIQRLTCPPCEILVLAPDIALYAAALQWVFEQRGGPFDYSITGTQADSSLLQGLQILLSLPARRFSLDGFKKLLLCTPFLERFELTVQEGEELSAWMSELNLRYDLSGHVGSWHAALKRMIEGLVKTGVFDFSDAPLVNRWIDMTLKLEKELTPISDGEKRSGKEWARLVQQWIEVFFKSDEETDILSSLLAILRHDRVDGLFPYETIHHHLQAACASGRGCIRRSSPDAIRFTSFKAGTATSAKVIICMGMQEGAFPRPDLPSSLAELPLPSRAMEDRYLFLEAISHAEEKLIITYQRCHPDDGKEVHPSSVIQELSKDRGGLVLTHHPLRCAEMGSKATRNKGPLTCPPKKVIDIRVLRKLARHPVRCFLEEGLGLRFHPHKTEAEFLFSPLEMHHLRKKSRRIGLDELVHELGCEGKLPSGSFEAAALLSIEKEINAYQSALAELQIDPASVFSLELTPHAKTFKRVSEDLCVAPALHVGTVQLQGIIEDVSPQGLLFHGEEKIEDLLKVWPLYIIVQIVLGPSPIFFTKKAATATTTLANPHEALERYICYLHKSLQTPSPLLPAWGRRIFKGEEPPLSTEDEILLWAIERDLLPPIKEWTAEWAPYLQEVVRELV
jgi:exodeoxyribonuclease V gamma subunit